MRFTFIALFVVTHIASPAAWAQADANATRAAGDAFGFRSGDDSVGIYDETSVRGFNLEAAGNYRVNDSYFVRNSGVSSFFLESTTVHIGYNTLTSLLPGPSGVVGYRLRDPARAEPSSLTVGLDPYGQPYADLLVKHRAEDDRFSYSAGIGRVFEVHDLQGGAGGGSWLFGGAGRISLGPARAHAFLGEYEYERPGQYRVRPDSEALPAELPQEQFLGQDWALERGQRRIAGVLVDAPTGQHTGVGGTVVFSQEDPSRGYAQIFEDFRGDGTVRSLMLAIPQQRSTAWSGELRSHWQRAGTRWDQRLDLALRGRRSRARFGGVQGFDLGRVQFGDRPEPIEAPDIDDAAARLHDAVDQWGLGLTYRAHLHDKVRLNLGALRTDYRKTFVAADGARLQTRTQPWLYNAGAAWKPIPKLELYGSYSRGLEEAGVAPATASNANEVLSAIEVTQRELGLQYALGANMKAVVAAFDTRKPYAGIDATDGVYRFIGQVRHRGLEMSFSGNPTPNLTVVLGGVLLDASLGGQGVADGRLGEQPVGVPRIRAIGNADYAIAAIPGLSIDIAATLVGERAARSTVSQATGQQLMVGSSSSINLGARYRFQAGALRMTARAIMSNIADDFAWEPNSAETLNYSAPRRLKLVLTGEF